MFVDSHCHLDYFENTSDIISEAKDHGVKFIQTIATSIDNFFKIYSIAESDPSIFASVGLHPLYCKDNKIPSPQELVEIISAHPKVIGIGETGLDFYYEKDPVAQGIQEKSFINHIIAAQETNLPLIIHTRDADKMMMQIIDDFLKNKSFSAVFHCFTSSKELAEFAIERGFYISASGIITFKKSEELREIFKEIPIERILIETDAPYLAPEPYRGKQNRPSYVTYVASTLGDIHGKSQEEIGRITTENFRRLFLK